jgi:hypothetical protein
MYFDIYSAMCIAEHSHRELIEAAHRERQTIAAQNSISGLGSRVEVRPKSLRRLSGSVHRAFGINRTQTRPAAE